MAALLRLRVGVVPGEPLPGARAPVPLHAPGPRLPRLRAAGLSGAGRWDNRSPDVSHSGVAEAEIYSRYNWWLQVFVNYPKMEASSMNSMNFSGCPTVPCS